MRKGKGKSAEVKERWRRLGRDRVKMEEQRNRIREKERKHTER